ncbi:MAG: ankyrin repeat domain-containing protein [Alphaproteobacteria bacterium]|nr:ankyrin repeat domain-containing protein [Alphaproteobacteria bacterium]
MSQKPAQEAARSDADDANMWLLKHVQAAELTEEKITACLAHGADINATNNHGKSLLLIAAHNGDADAVELLLKHGADIEQKSGFAQDTALSGAAGKGRINAIDILLKNGANIEAESEGGYTPLLCAVNAGYSKTVERLLEAGANVNVAKHDGVTALAMSIDLGKNDIFKLLLQWEADVNKANQQGRTPLMLACEYADEYKINTLLNWGANIDARNIFGENALDITRRTHGHESSIECILQSEIQRRTIAAFQKAAERGTTKTRKIRRPRTAQPTPVNRR